MKSSVALIVGIVFVVGALGVGALALLQGQGDAEPQPTPAELAELAAAEARIAAEEAREAAERLKAQQLKQDNDDIRRIIVSKVAETPKELTDGWFVELFRYIPIEDSLDAHLEDVLKRGAAYDVRYTAEFQQEGSRKVQSTDPRFYINTKAGEIIHSPSPTDKKLRNEALGFLALGVYREHQLKEGWEHVRPEILSSYFHKSIKLWNILKERVVERGRSDAAEREKLLQLHEVVAMDRYRMVKEGTMAARQRFKETTQSAAHATGRIGQWRKTLKQELLEIGRLYIEAAEREHRYIGKRQEHADRGFMALAMVHQLKDSPEALKYMIKANRIQRDYLWRMAKAHWKTARKAAVAADHAAAGEAFLLAKRRYLQSLSRIEGSKQKFIFKELHELQKEITAWYHQKNAVVVEES